MQWHIPTTPKSCTDEHQDEKNKFCLMFRNMCKKPRLREQEKDEILANKINYD